MIQTLVEFLLRLTADMGYFGVFVLMSVESSFIPFPSEIVVPPAAFLAAKGEMNLYLVILAGVLGSLVGASVNYFLARTLGRTIIFELIEHKFARFLLLNKEKIEKSEKLFLKYGGRATFFGRMLPAIRQLISLPAGFVRMNFGKFLGFTFLGSFLWVSVLALLGFYFGENEAVLSQYYNEITFFVVGFVVLFFVFNYFLRRRR